MPRIELETQMPANKIAENVRLENEKDSLEADTLIKVLEGRSNELSFIRRKAAGAVLHQLSKVMIDRNKKDWIIQNLKQRIAEGTEKIISIENGKLVLEFSEFDMIGVDMLKRRSAAENNLKVRFHATSLKYLEEKEMEKNVIESETVKDVD